MIFFIILFCFDIILWGHIVTASICDYSDNGEPQCCSGWIKNVYGDCVKSECDYDCGYGRCVGMNVCECYDKTVRTETCPQTYQKLCTNNCSNKGQCLNGKCICESGYFGEDCNKTIISTCYVKIDRGLCKSTPENLQLSKEECCSIFQVAWGNPCVFCDRNYCPKGFIRKNNRCDDIDECQFKSICLNGECINEKGSFRCQCPPDHYLDENTMSCQYRKDQCQLYGSTCGIFGRCISTSDGQYTCICRKPYSVSFNGKSCVKNSNYNVCNYFKKLCQPYGECQPFGLSYYCSCPSGFHQSEDKKSCIINANSDICQSAEIAERCRGGSCVSEGKGYRCLCSGEYQSHNNDQECVRYSTSEPRVSRYCSKWEFYSLCEGGECVDLNNDYYCKCNEGYYSTENRRRCIKMETRTSSPRNSYCDIPSNRQRCANGDCVDDLYYGFKCICRSGYKVAEDGRACYKIETFTLCSLNQFQCQGGGCQELDNNNYECQCLRGFIRSENGRSCVKAERTRNSTSICEQYSHRCQTGVCYPIYPNDYICACLEGYSQAEDKRSCIKSEQYNDYCQNQEISKRCRGGQCISNGNSYRCVCYGKYVSNNNDQECIKYKPTESPYTRLCSKWEYYSLCQGGECVDTNNNYYCKCKAGFYAVENRRKCERIDERVTQEPDNSYCLIQEYSSRCKGGRCIGDMTYGFKCLCLTGFTAASDGRSCEPEYVDQCLKNGNACTPGRCERLGNSDFHCVCPYYASASEDGRSCIINYITTESTRNYCDILANRLRCATGDCVIDRCICRSGYKISEDGKECYKIEKVSSACSLNQLQCQGGGCLELDDNNYECQCLKGYIRSENGRSCLKTESALIQKSICDLHREKCKTGVCYPIAQNDYVCACVQGYRQASDKRSCIKTQDPKCAVNEHRCKGGYCYDIINGYLCICVGNYVVTENGRDCIIKSIAVKSMDISEDFYQNPLSQSICTKKEIIEKCMPGKCAEEHDGYQCTCPHSFKSNDYGHECVRDSTKCPYCFYGCFNDKSISACSCPENYENLFNTGLCIKKSDAISYSLGDSSCHSKSSKRTMTINFSGLFTFSIGTPLEIKESIGKILLIKQQRSIRLSYCGLQGKSQKIPKNELSNSLLTRQIVCVFYCQ